MLKITTSEKRPPTPQQINVGENSTLTTWGAIKINKSHFFPSSFQLKTATQVLYIDPIEIDTTEKADYLLITHSHLDHFSRKDIKKILKTDTEIICSRAVKKRLKKIDNVIRVVRPGDKLKRNDFNVEAIAAYNTKTAFLWFKAHPKSKENVGFLITLNDGARIYHAGDTDYIPEMKTLTNIKIALVPIGGDNLTMNEEEAARIINEIKPQKVVPIHYEIKNREQLNRFRAIVDDSIEVIELE